MKRIIFKVFFTIAFFLLSILLFSTRVKADYQPPVPDRDQTAEQVGWTYVGDSTGVGGWACFDLAGTGVSKVRYVMWVNRSCASKMDTAGSDPSGLIVIHAQNPEKDKKIGAKRVYFRRTGSVGEEDCEDHSSRTLGKADECDSTWQCGCALGYDDSGCGRGGLAGDKGDSGIIVWDQYYDENNIVDGDGVDYNGDGDDGDDFCTFEIGADESYAVYVIEEVVPWFMTAYGDTYASSGYSNELEMKKVTSYPVPTKVDDQATFSTYMISSGNNKLVSPHPSLRKIRIKSYNDMNRYLFPNAGNSIYDYLMNVVENNYMQCDQNKIEIVEDLPVGGCSGQKIYFINDDSEQTLSATWNQGTKPTRACVIISRGSIRIPDNIKKMDVMLLADRKITTLAGSGTPDTLFINGSVISSTIYFSRDNGSNITQDPAELLNYDPKYLDLLRDCLGKDYPVSVKEYRYPEIIGT